MLLEMFFNFDGNCREATRFYARIFKTTVNNLMTYGDTPSDSGYVVPAADRDRIMYAGLPFDNMVLMCMDVPTGAPFHVGDNISPTISFADKAEVRRVFTALSRGGIVHAKPAPSFFSELYASCTDKFGITWQILYYVPPADATDADEAANADEAADAAAVTAAKAAAVSSADAPAKPGGKDRHRWSKQVSDVVFTVERDGAKAQVMWPQRGEMLVKKGAKLMKDPPLLKNGTLGFSARGGLMIRDEQKDAIKEFTTTRDVILRSVNEVGLFLYFGGTNSWLQLKDKDGKTINDYTVVA